MFAQVHREILSSQTQDCVGEIELQLKSRALQHLDSNVGISFWKSLIDIIMAYLAAICASGQIKYEHNMYIQKESALSYVRKEEDGWLEI